MAPRLAASIAEGVLLDPATHLVERGVWRAGWDGSDNTWRVSGRPLWPAVSSGN